MVGEFAQYFGLDLPKSDLCTVYDRYGQLVATGHLHAVREHLPRGIYFVRLQDEKLKIEN